jgi:hypothetical protein
MTFSATPKFIVATQRFFIPKIHNFFCLFNLTISTSIYKKNILMKSPTPVGQQQQPTPHPTQRNATQRNATTATKNWIQQQQQSSKFDK